MPPDLIEGRGRSRQIPLRSFGARDDSLEKSLSIQLSGDGRFHGYCIETFDPLAYFPEGAKWSCLTFSTGGKSASTTEELLPQVPPALTVCIGSVTGITLRNAKSQHQL